MPNYEFTLGSLKKKKKNVLHTIGFETTCKMCWLPSDFSTIHLMTRRARVFVLFLSLARLGPILRSTSAFLSFKMPMQSSL